MSINQQIRFWLLASAAFIGLVWLLSPMLLPFVTGFAIAYFLNPIASVLYRIGIPRSMAVPLVLTAFIAVAVLVLMLIVPLFQEQITALIAAAPDYAERMKQIIVPWVTGLLNRLSPDDVDKLRTAAGEQTGEAINWVARFLRQILTSGFALFSVVTFVLITPLVAFFIMRDWDVLTRIIDDSLPRRHYDIIRAQMHKIDQTLAGFVRGQALVCLSLSIYYASALTLIGLHFGASVGLTTGLLAFIPYVGTTFGWVTSLLLAWMQTGDWSYTLPIVGVFLFGQVIENYVLTPRLVGNRVGLHPVWVIFGLFAGASLFGFVGAMIAVPLTAVIGVLLRFGMQQYRASRYYQDVPSQHPRVG